MKSWLIYISSIAIFGTVAMFRRLIPLSSSVIAFSRGMIGALFLIAFVRLSGHKPAGRLSAKNIALLAFTGALIGINWILLFEAYNYTTIAAATLCYYMQPVIVIMLSPLIFKEKLTLRKLLCVAAAVIGMCFVSGASVSSMSGAKGILLALGGAVLYASVVILNKKMPDIDTYEKTIIELAAAALVLLPYLIPTGGLSFAGITVKAALLLLTMGLVHTGIAYAMYYGSLNNIKAQTASMFSYLDPVVTLITSAVFFHEPMTALSIAGTVLILGSAVMSEL